MNIWLQILLSVLSSILQALLQKAQAGQQLTAPQLERLNAAIFKFHRVESAAITLGCQPFGVPMPDGSEVTFDASGQQRHFGWKSEEAGAIPVTISLTPDQITAVFGQSLSAGDKRE